MTQKQMEEEENAAFLERATQRVTGLPISDQSKVPAGPSGSLLKPSRTQMQFGKEAGPFQEASKRVNTSWMDGTPKAPATVSEGFSSIKNNVMGSSGGFRGARDSSDAQFGGALEKLIRTAERKAFQDGTRHESAEAELERAFREAIDRAESHEKILKKSTLNPFPGPSHRTAPVSALGRTNERRSPRRLEPWNLRAGKSVSSRKAFGTLTNRNCSPDKFIPDEQLLETDRNLNTPRNSVDNIDCGVTVDWERRTETGKSSTEPNLSSVTNAPEDSSLFPVSAVNNRRGGTLSSSEHSGLSSLLQSLKSQLAHAQDVGDTVIERNGDVTAFSQNVPLSPYQLLQAKNRRTKEQPKPEGKKRLQENPWAQLLASPVRMCQATGVRLPSKLMVGWSYVRNPKDGQVYLMPEELANMTHLDVGTRKRFSAGENTHRLSFQEAGSSDGVNIVTDEAQGHFTRPADTPDAEAEPNGEDSSSLFNEADSDHPGQKPPIAPAKIYMRPSSILLKDLNNRMLVTEERMFAKDKVGPVRLTKTNLSAVSRLVPARWKDQARTFEKSADPKKSHAGFLTTQEMGKVQWHPDIHDVMLNLLRLRVLKALEGLAVRNSHHTGTSRRTVPLPWGEADSFGEDVVKTTLSGVDQAVLLWHGLEESSARGLQSKTGQSSRSRSVSPSTCHTSMLQLIPCQTLTALEPNHPATAPERTGPAFTLTWTQLEAASKPSPLETIQQQQQQQQNTYIPPSIPLQLPTDGNHNSPTTTTNNALPQPQPIRHLPIFDLPSLLGPSHMTKLHTNPAVVGVFGLGCNDRPGAVSGWVMVKGGKGTKGFKDLMQEIWRLWLYVGGRRGIVVDE
jgi:hypothetical protein